MTRKHIACIASVLSAALCLYLLLQRHSENRHRPKAHRLLLVDASDSLSRDCAKETALVRSSLEGKQVPRGSMLVILRTGDETTRLEPQLAYQAEMPRASIGGPFGGQKRVDRMTDAFWHNVAVACMAVPQLKASPILKGVVRGLEQLRSMGCGPQSHCMLIVHSDLQDNDVLPRIRSGSANFGSEALIDNHGIRTVLCGYSEGVRDPRSVGIDARLEFWRTRFAAPATIAPFCGTEIFTGAHTVNNTRRSMTPFSNQKVDYRRPPIRSPATLDFSAPLIRFSPSDYLSLGASFEGTLITGAPGSGKSTTSGKSLAYAFLRTPGMGGLILTAKAEETRNWISYAKDCGREQDLIIFNADSGHLFDPLWYEWNRPGRGAADLETIIDLFSTLLAIGKPNTGLSPDRFWELATEMLVRNVLVLLSLSGEPISIANMHRVIQSLPAKPGEFEEESWQKESYCAALVNHIRERQDELTAAQWSDLEIATHFAFRRWPALDERPRSSIEWTFGGMADKFLFQPFNRIFCSGKCTFVPELTTHQGKIVICDFPLLEYGHETGRLVNVLTKLVFQRAWLRRNIHEAPNPVFLFQDEFQYFVTRRDNVFQQTCRGARAAVVCLTQNLLNLSEELGETQPGSKTKAFIGNLALKIFHQQNDPDTCAFGAEQIGKEYKYLDSFSADAVGNASTGAAKQLAYNVEPIEFSRLGKPDAENPISIAIVYQGGTTFNATKTPDNPRGRNHLTVAFTREL